MINFLIYHHSQKYSFTRRPNTQLYMQFACYRKQKIKKFINPQSRQQQNASPSPYHPIGTTSHIPTPQNTTTSQQPPVTTTKNSFKKKPEGCAEGPWLYGPFAVFHSFPKQKNQALCQESKNKTKNQPYNKQRKRKSQRKIKKKNKRKNKGEKA